MPKPSPNVNSAEYWDHRFQTNWLSLHGDKQTEFFGNLILENLPKDLIGKLSEQAWSFCDIGCAQGQLADLLSQHFPNLRISGVDFSESAIKIAKNEFPKINFYTKDLAKIKQSYDITLCSNTLEHFEDPLKAITSISRITRNYMIVLNPFQEVDRIPEHFTTFDYDNIPLTIDNFALEYYRVIDCTKFKVGYWYGKQILLIYSKITPQFKFFTKFVEKRQQLLYIRQKALEDELKNKKLELDLIKSSKYYRLFQQAKGILHKKKKEQS